MTDTMDGAISGPIEIPYSELSEQALRSVVEHFVLREGTDYGTHVYSLQEKVEQVLAQLRDLVEPRSSSIRRLRRSTSWLTPAALERQFGDEPLRHAVPVHRAADRGAPACDPRRCRSG